jgi:hypothetical protein
MDRRVRDLAPVADSQIEKCFDAALATFQRRVFEFVILPLDTARALMRYADLAITPESAQRCRRKAFVIVSKAEKLLPEMIVISSSDREQLEPKLKALKHKLSACGFPVEQQRRAAAASE